jgi:FtsP/CotA-like multicopper oxidase with cupredoxin domain
MLSRRQLLQGSSALLAVSPFSGYSAEPAAKDAAYSLTPQPFQRAYAIAGGKPSEFWGFNGSAPGPELRFRKGDVARIAVTNALPADTAVHWHGLRVPHAMDGVPGLSQPPIRPGESFVYELPLKDSGTFWYHPHERSFEQVGRGLYGALIVEEAAPPPVDRDITWLLSDFLLDPATGAHQPFGVMAAHAEKGRLGNVIAINGVDTREGIRIDVARGERLRLRLVNACTARVFSLAFEGHEPWVLAFDGHGVTPHRLAAGATFLAPGMRLDLIIDGVHDAGREFAVTDRVSGTRLARLAYPDMPPLRKDVLPAPARLAANDLPLPDLKSATHHEIEFRGGNAGPPVIGKVDNREVSYDDMKQRYGLAWTVAGHAAMEHVHVHEPLLALKRNSTCVLTLSNNTGFVHPIHLHGLAFQVLSYNGTAPAYPEWRDTVFMDAFDEVQIAFVADNPGDWMFHCHILEHAASGMMGVVRVE